jgi:cell division protein ZapA
VAGNDALQPFVVSIRGRAFTIQSDEEEAYVRQLAAFVDEKMSQVRSGGDSVGVAVLAALHIADELHRLRREYAQLTSKIEALSRDLARTLDQSDRSQMRL